MLLAEVLGERRVPEPGQDLRDRRRRRRAGAGPPGELHGAKAGRGAAAELRERYFERSTAATRSAPTCAARVIFGRHDLMQDAPISRVDLLVCRNTLMYFNAETQARILGSFAFALRDGGYLFLGKSEMLLIRASTSFAPVDLRRRVFAEVPRATSGAGPASRRALARRASRPGRRVAARRRVRAWPRRPQLVIDARRRLVLANARPASLFGAVRRATSAGQFQELEISYRPVELRSRIEEASAERRPGELRDVEWRRRTEPRIVDVHVAPLVDADGRARRRRASPSPTSRATARLQRALEPRSRELETAYEELQSTIEELETTNEELQSTNEELETTNEELQSTNEELETMNEELQSTNEELETINDELRLRGDELNRSTRSSSRSWRAWTPASSSSTATCACRSGTPRPRDLWGLRDDEVAGQHLLEPGHRAARGPARAPLRRCCRRTVARPSRSWSSGPATGEAGTSTAGCRSPARRRGRGRRRGHPADGPAGVD